MPQRIIHYADDTIDRAAPYRDDRSWLDERLQAETSRFVAIVAGKHLIADVDARRPHFLRAGDFEGSPPAEAVLLGVRKDIAYFGLDLTDAPPPLPERVTLRGLRDVIVDLGHADSAILAHASALVHWHRTHRFCGACGQPTTSGRGGHVRRCTGEDCRREHFPGPTRP